MNQDWHAQARDRMVDDLRRKGIWDDRVLEAMRTVPRHQFVLPDTQRSAYTDSALPLFAGATISQPYIVALMTQALRLDGSEHVLEVGTGSGYGASVLARLAAKVVTIETVPELVEWAKKRVPDSVQVILGDGSLGYPSAAPFDAISVTAAAPELPSTLIDQLRLGGRIVVPIGPQSGRQQLRLVTVSDNESGSRHEVVDLATVRFVPLTGRAGHV